MRIQPTFLTLAFCIAAPLAATAQDISYWGGAYAGAQISHANGFQDYGGGGYDLRGPAYGLFAGYMWASGPLAYGVEVSYASADFSSYDGGLALSEYRFNHTFDLKARAGYAMGQSLLYGTIGYGSSEWEEGGTDPDYLFDAKGILYGIGIDYVVSDRFFLGGELLRRNLDNDVDLPFEADLTTLSLRAGLKF